MGTTRGGSKRHYNRVQDTLPAHGSSLAPDRADHRGKPAHVRAGQAREKRELPGASVRFQRQRHGTLFRVARHRDLRERLARVRGAERPYQHEK